MKKDLAQKEKILYKAALKAAEKLEVGTKVRVNPLLDLMGFDGWRDGTVTYINKENGWFLVEYQTTKSRLPQKKAYQFFSIGRTVYIDGEANITMHNILENAS